MAILIWVNPALRLQAITWTNSDLYVTTSDIYLSDFKWIPSPAVFKMNCKISDL